MIWWIIIQNLIEYFKTLSEFTEDEIHPGMDSPIKHYPCTEVIWDGDIDPDLHYLSKGTLAISLDQYVKSAGNAAEAYAALFFLHKKTIDALRGYTQYAKDTLGIAIKLKIGSVVNITGATSRPSTGSTMPIEIEWKGGKHYDKPE